MFRRALLLFLIAAVVAPTAANAATISIDSIDSSTSSVRAQVSGVSDPCSGPCFGEFFTAYKTTPGAVCGLVVADNNIAAFQQLAASGGAFAGVASFTAPLLTPVQLCVEVERWNTSPATKDVVASASVIVTPGALPPSPPTLRTHVRGKGRLKVERNLTLEYGCSKDCEADVRAIFLKPGKNFDASDSLSLPVQDYGIFRYHLKGGQYRSLQHSPGAWRVRLQVSATAIATGATDSDSKLFRFQVPRRISHGGGGGTCEPGYSPCLPVTGDLDCDQIPASEKPVTVTGSDPYRLDADNDGIGCED